MYQYCFFFIFTFVFLFLFFAIMLLYLICFFFICFICFFFFKLNTAYELRISDWSSDVCSSDLFFFGERWYGFDDGIYAAARLLEILATEQQAPSEVLNALPNGVSTPEIKVDAPNGDPHAFVERFVAQSHFDD